MYYKNRGVGIRIKKISFFSILMIGVYVVLLFLTQSQFNTSNWNLLYCIYTCIIIVHSVFILIKNRMYLKFKKNEVYAYSMFLIPYFALLLLSIIEASIGRDMTIAYTIKENLYQIIIVLASIVAYKYYSKNIVDIVFYSTIINYSIYVLYYINNYGFAGLLNFISLSETIHILEVHEETFIFGLLFVYYFVKIRLKSSDYNLKDRFKCLICALYMFLGYKRILFAAIVVSLFFYKIFDSNFNRNKTRLFSYVVFGICAGWILFVTNDLYEYTAELLNIELNSRSFSNGGLYGRLDGYYKMSIMHIGQGIGLVTKVLRSFSGYSTVSLHNDILKYYIELGCIPWIIYFGNMIICNSRRIIKKYSVKQANWFLCLLLLTLICWTTDNLSTYPNYLFVQYILLLDILLTERSYIILSSRKVDYSGQSERIS